MDAYHARFDRVAPVVICTAHRRPAVIAHELGAVDYLPKPFVIDQVLALVGAHTAALADSVQVEELLVGQ
jgi:DNA-binding response OmpR family regulator